MFLYDFAGSALRAALAEKECTQGEAIIPLSFGTAVKKCSFSVSSSNKQLVAYHSLPHYKSAIIMFCALHIHLNQWPLTYDTLSRITGSSQIHLLTAPHFVFVFQVRESY